MKHCPVCHAEYADAESSCPRDGSLLLEAPVGLAGPNVERPRRAEESEPPAAARVEVVQPTGETVGAALTAGDLSIGTAPENGLVLADPAVSRRHALVRRQQGQWYILDAGSRNGVYVNGRRVGPDGARIETADAVLMGHSRLRLVLGPAAAGQAAPLDAAAVSQPGGEASPPAPGAGQGSPGGVAPGGRYQLEREIRRDFTGVLYRAHDVADGKPVTVRVLAPELLRDAVAVERFRRQARVAASIHHPNSVQVYDSGFTPEGGGYIVEEPLSGRTLRDLVQSERGLTVARVVGILNQICGAVHAANLNGIVLRDIRPESIFVERGADGAEVIKVGDYGLAKVDQALSGGVTMAFAARTYGAPQYMSPEQFLGRPLDSRSDVYSLGVILFELLTGAVPFDSPNPDEVVRMQLDAPVPDLTESGRPDLDEGVAAVVSRALAKDPKLRQPTALDLANELQAVSGAPRGLVGTLILKATGAPPVAPLAPPLPPPADAPLPSVVAGAEPKGRGAYNPVVLALTAEAFLSRVSSGLLKTIVPLYVLLVFRWDITEVMLLVLAQNLVPILLRSLFGTLADRYGKKRVFMISLFIRTAVGLLYASAVWPAMLFAINAIRGIADSARVPSASGMIADNTDEKHIAKAYSWYTTTKSTSGGIGESAGAFLLPLLVVFLAGTWTTTANVAVLEGVTKHGEPAEAFLKSTDEVGPDGTIPGDEAHPQPRRVVRAERREVRLSEVPAKDLPKVVDAALLRSAIIAIFVLSTALSGLSLILVWFFIKEGATHKAKGKEAKVEGAPPAGAAAPAPTQPNVWAFALLGLGLTAPAYMVTGEFFTALAVKLGLTLSEFGWIKIVAEMLIPLLFGPLFGWLADRIGTGKVIALRSVANLLTSALFWITPWFLGTALLSLMMGTARAVDEVGKAAFKPTWGAITAKVSSFNLAGRSRTMGILEGGVDASDLVFPVLAGVLLDYVSLGVLMAVRAALSLLAELYGHVLSRKYKI